MIKIDRPNFGIYVPDYKYTYIGDNNLRREFFDCFSIILSSCYEDDTKSARYFNKMESDGTSAYYIHQPNIEQELEDFAQSPGDSEKFLIGFTGIGKTTLLKNFFKILDSNPFYAQDGSLIVYLSVYSDILENEDDLENIFCSCLWTVVEELEKKCPFSLSIDEHIDSLYKFIAEKDARKFKEGKVFGEPPKNKHELLTEFAKNDPISFLAKLISFLTEKINATNTHIPKIVLIYDDIEAQDAELHIPFIKIAEKISTKLRSAADERSFAVKSLIALRNYTFRYNFGRQADAMRDYTEDVILKDQIPRMKDIFEKRFNVYYENEEVRNAITSEERWTKSVELLRGITSNIAELGDTISAIANYDISHSLKMFLRVLTNHRWFAPTEEYYDGAYILNPRDYLPLKDRTLKALVYGENSVFVDSEDNILPNILAVHMEEKADTELLSLYVMEYMLSLQRGHRVTLYGKHKIIGKDLRQNIINILNCEDKIDLVEYSIERLYKQRCLLQSIFEAEPQSVNKRYAYEREYHESMGLYLSIRGNRILDLLENDSILLEIFRDDIDTSLFGNRTPSAYMTQTDRLKYLIDYCSHLFEIEKNYIRNANQAQYFRTFGGYFLVSRLVRGIKNSIKYYYKKPDNNYLEVRNALSELLDDMAQYKVALLENDNSLQIEVVNID